MGGLISTVTQLPSDAATSAARHNELLDALDEVLRRRFNERSFRVFADGTLPAIETGDEYLFGTASNLWTSAAAYLDVHETPAVPSGGSVISSDPVTKYVWVTGYAGYRTLNRHHCLFSPDGIIPAVKYWFGYVTPERWEPYALADIFVENYLETHNVVTPATNVFTLRDGWDRHGVYRVHNGNRFTLTILDAVNAVTFEVPAYGVITLRRTEPTGTWTRDGVYMARTREHDRMQWHSIFKGNFAGSMSLAEALCGSIGGQSWARVKPVLGFDSTLAEQGLYTGAAPATTDKASDWLYHKGSILSVVLDKRDGTITTKVLKWNGIDSVPDATWVGCVWATLITSTTLRLESTVTPPAGAIADQWEHDLIPITTNLLGNAIVQLHAGGTLTHADINFVGGVAPLLRGPLPLQAFAAATASATKPLTPVSSDGGGAAFTLTTYSPGGSAFSGPTSWTQTVGSAMAVPSPLTGFNALDSGPIIKTHVGTIRSNLIETHPEDMTTQVAFNSDLIRDGYVYAGHIRWRLADGMDTLGDRMRFSATIPRKWDPCGSLVGGVAVFPAHPQEGDLLGTSDGLAGALSWGPPTAATGSVKFDNVGPYVSDPLITGCLTGAAVWLPSDALDWIHENIQTENWWKDHRTALIAGPPEDAKLRAMRMPRRVGQFDDMAELLGAVQYVRRVSIEDLHRDPLPPGCQEKPFNYGGEHPFAVPGDFGAGRNETGDSNLTDWAATWGITVQTTLPGVASLKSGNSQVWAKTTAWYFRQPDFGGSGLVYLRAGSLYWYQHFLTWGTPPDYAQWYPHMLALLAGYDDATIPDILTDVSKAATHTLDSETTTTVHGYTFSSWRTWTPDACRMWFGGAGDDAHYVWVKRSDILTVFSPLGVAPVDSDPHEVFVPRWTSPSTHPTAIQGDVYSGPHIDGTTVLTSSTGIPAGEPIKDTIGIDSDSALWWWAVPEEETVFRLAADVGTSRRRFTITGAVWPATGILQHTFDNYRPDGSGLSDLVTSSMYWPDSNDISTLAAEYGGGPVLADPWYVSTTSGTYVFEPDDGGYHSATQGIMSSRQMGPKLSGDDLCKTFGRVKVPFDAMLSGTPCPTFWAEWATPTTDHLVTDAPGDSTHKAAVIAAGTEISTAYLHDTLGWPAANSYLLQWSRMGNQDVSGFLNDA